jgi:hypothetical protein
MSKLNSPGARVSDLFKTAPARASTITSMDNQFAAGRDFILRQGRLLERRLFAACFEGAPGTGVVDALRGYRNDDGGFGHGLEPDLRCPASLPIDVEVALRALVMAREPVTDGAAGAVMAREPVTDGAGGALVTDGEPLVRDASEYLARVAASAGRNGAVPPTFSLIEAYPRAAHWTEQTYEPGLNPTAGLVGLLRRLRADHPWVAKATSYCWEQISGPELPADAHALSEVLVFLEHAPERDRADEAAARVRQQLTKASSFRADPGDPSYGLTPLSIAPLAGSRWRSLFTDGEVAAHLEQLQSEQQDDGGWPIRWEPPSEAATLEWRGIVTLEALRTLVSYGRLHPSA